MPEAAEGTADLAAAYLRLLGPATDTETAKFLGTNRSELRRAWPDGLVEVRVAGRGGWFPQDRLAELRSAPPPPALRLLPPGDPFLQARDRAFLVPDERHHATMWKNLGNPGALLVDGDIAGAWRARMVGGRTLELTVTPFGPLSAARRRDLADEVDRMAAVRGAKAVRLLANAP